MTKSDHPAATCGNPQEAPTSGRIEALRQGRSTCGTRAAYVRGCRCESCTSANRAYARDREQRRQEKLARLARQRTGNGDTRSCGGCPGPEGTGCPDGGWVRKDSPGGLCARCRASLTFEGRVRSDRAAEHLRKLSERGVGRNAVCEASGVARSILQAIRTGRRPWIFAKTERAILDVDERCMADHACVPAAAAWRAVRKMNRLGWTKARIGRELGQKGRSLQLSRERITLRHSDQLQRLVAKAEREVAEAKLRAREEKRAAREREKAERQLAVAARRRCVRCGRVHDDDLVAAKWCLEHRNVPLSEAEKLRERGGRSAWNA